MAKHILTTPIQASDLKGIKAGGYYLLKWSYHNMP